MSWFHLWQLQLGYSQDGQSDNLCNLKDDGKTEIYSAILIEDGETEVYSALLIEDGETEIYSAIFTGELYKVHF